MKKPSREFVRYFFMIIILLSILTGIRYYSSYHDVENRIDSQVEDTMSVFENRIVNTYDDRLRDLIYTREITERLLHSGVELERIEEIYYEFAKSLGLYDQVRLIDIRGNELVRINYGKGKPKIVPAEELQEKLDRYYFQETVRIDHYGIYLSPLDLNEEGGVIERPFKPMIRLGMQIQDQNGNPQGVVILNYLAENWIDVDANKLADYPEPMVDFDDLWIVNPQGYYVHHQDDSREWGFMLSGREAYSLVNDYPDLWEDRNASLSQKSKQSDAILYLKKIPALEPPAPYYSEPYELGFLVYHFPLDQYENYFDAAKQEWLAWMAGSIFVALLGAYFLEGFARSRKEMIDNLHMRANRDHLTGLLNKSGFQAMLPGERNRWNDGILAIGYFDIDDFKSVNDQYGHAVGDEILLEVGNRLKQVLRERDLPARIHGDEFNILLKLRKEIDARVVARRLINRMKDPIVTTAGEIAITVSLGIAFYGEEESFEEVAERADRLMYEVKRTGKSDYRIEGLAQEA